MHGFRHKHEPLRFAVMVEDHEDGTATVSLMDTEKKVGWHSKRLPMADGLDLLDHAGELMERLNHPEKFVGAVC